MDKEILYQKFIEEMVAYGYFPCSKDNKKILSAEHPDFLSKKDWDVIEIGYFGEAVGIIAVESKEDGEVVRASYVLPEYRRRGFASEKMISHIWQGRKEGYSVKIPKGDEKAKRFFEAVFERTGYREVKKKGRTREFTARVI